jgi:hypothetical protein
MLFDTISRVDDGTGDGGRIERGITCKSSITPITNIGLKAQVIMATKLQYLLPN